MSLVGLVRRLTGAERATSRLGQVAQRDANPLGQSVQGEKRARREVANNRVAAKGIRRTVSSAHQSTDGITQCPRDVRHHSSDLVEQILHRFRCVLGVEQRAYYLAEVLDHMRGLLQR